MKRVFIDASVLFSATLSATGASSELIRYSLQNRIALVANELVLEEVEKNITAKNIEVLDQFQSLRQILALELIEPTREEIIAVLPYTVLKDAPHLATALKAKVDYLVSLDRKHLVSMRETVEQNLGLKILLPGELLQELRNDQSAQS